MNKLLVILLVSASLSQLVIAAPAESTKVAACLIVAAIRPSETISEASVIEKTNNLSATDYLEFRRMVKYYSDMIRARPKETQHYVDWLTNVCSS